MDDYEALKEAGGEITSLDTLVYVKSKSAAGYELDRSDISDLSLASGFVIDDATNGIRENLEANIRVNSREEVLVSLSVLDRFDSEDAALARGYLLGVRTEGYYSQQLETNSSLRGAELGQYAQTQVIYDEQNAREQITLKSAVNLDFGADYSRAAYQNYQNGEYIQGTVNIIAGTCEAGYDTLAAYGGANLIAAGGTALATDKGKDAVFGAVTNTASYIATSEKVTISGTTNAIVTGGVTGLITSPMTGSAAYNTATRFFGGAVVAGSSDFVSQYASYNGDIKQINLTKTATNAILTGTGTAFGGLLNSSGTSYMTKSGLSNATMLIPAASTNYVVDQITKE